MLHRFILHNDEIGEAGEKRLAAGQVGLLAGWGVFTTMRVTAGVPFEFERHWARLARDAELLHVPLPGDREAIRRKLVELVDANEVPDCMLRLAMVRNRGGVWQGPAVERDCDVLALTANAKDWGEGVKLACQAQARHAQSMFAGTKVLSWAQNLVWLETAQQRGFDEVILLNEAGQVSECTSANIFIATGNQVWTPPTGSSGCLPGITREVLLKEIRVPGIEIGEKEITPEELEGADEVFITSTTRDLLQVMQVEGRRVGRGSRVQTELREAFAQYRSRYVAARKGLEWA